MNGKMPTTTEELLEVIRQIEPALMVKNSQFATAILVSVPTWTRIRPMFMVKNKAISMPEYLGLKVYTYTTIEERAKAIMEAKEARHRLMEVFD